MKPSSWKTKNGGGMLTISATNLFRSLSVLILATSMASPLDAFADRDQKCFQDCTERGYQWAFCDSKCSYNNNSQQGGLEGLGKAFATQGLAAGYMQGVEEGSRQALIQQQIENQRLQNEILRRQLDSQSSIQPLTPHPAIRACETSTDCGQGQSCRSSKGGGTECRSPAEATLGASTGITCSVDADCSKGRSCRSRKGGGNECR